MQPIHYAAKEGKTDELKRLLKHNPQNLRVQKERRGSRFANVTGDDGVEVRHGALRPSIFVAVNLSYVATSGSYYDPAAANATRWRS